MKKEFVRDLGVTMSNDGCFTKHIYNIISKVRDFSGWITRTFKSRSKKCNVVTMESTSDS